ncbi:uncharacterized protein L203_104412 [Cryptococcus depauperatus CBS 7841]|uniref:Uncharacterized protein n=1 Tax=Cryptococcus depauperatus CBS 7841 TaxID=1295531 RepID=A0A1E3IIN8_9TREE|nr:hypothetical protein L203_03349 [Cryptococcus depauperatus CBS 7841]
MSVDLSDPRLAAARAAVTNTADSTSWFLLHYSPNHSTPQVLQVLETGSDPVLPAWQEHLNRTTEGILFGYAEIAGKGLVLVYLRSDIGGVRRARAVVHSRAIASLFPDYSAIITISTPEELTEQLITDKLDLNAPSINNERPRYKIPGADVPDPLAPGATGLRRSLPAPPWSMPQHENITASAKNPKGPTGSLDTNSSSVRALGLGSPSRPPLPPPQAISTPSPADIHSHSVGSTQSRRASLTSRLKNTIHKSSSSVDETSLDLGNHHEKHSNSGPHSPSSGRFKVQTLSKVFGRRRSSANEETSPTSSKADHLHRDIVGEETGEERSDVPYAPPVPPKDDSSEIQPSISALGIRDHSHFIPGQPNSSGSTPIPDTKPVSSGIASDPLSSHVIIGSEVPRKSSLPNPSSPSLTNGSTLLNHIPQSTMMLPSPTAQQVLTRAREKQMEEEWEIQERFRKDLAKRKLSLNGEVAVEDEGGSTRVDREYSDKHDDQYEAKTEDFITTPYVANSSGLPAALSSNSPSLVLGSSVGGETFSVPESANQVNNTTAIPQMTTETNLEARQEEDTSHSKELRSTTDEQIEDSSQAMLEVNEAGTKDSDARAKVEEEQMLSLDNKMPDEEHSRTEHTSGTAQAQKEDGQSEQKQIATESSGSPQRAEEEQCSSEDKHQAEEQAQRENVENEKKKIEEKRQQQEILQAKLCRDKNEGNLMLRGWATVQTYKSMTWRRRHFEIWPKEMKLFKNEGDVKPIQTIVFGPSTTVSEQYEESQVKDSFKVISDRGAQGGLEEFFLFTDSAEDKDVVLRSLRMCIS